MELPLALRLLETCPVGIVTLDAHGRVNWANDRLTTWLGVERAELLGTATSGATPDAPALLRTQAEELELDDGRRLSCERQRFEPPVDEVAEVRYYLPAGADGDWRRAITDPLTGLMSRRALMLALEPQVARSRRYQRPLALAVVTLDIPPDVEAEQREQAFVAAGQLLRDKLRWADLLGFDGGIFMVALPETDAAGTRRLVRKIQDHFELPPAWAAAAGPFADTVRYGVAEWRKGDDASNLIQRALTALESAREAASTEPDEA